MSKTTKIVIFSVVALVVIVGVVFYMCSISASPNPVVGTYRETRMQIILKSDNTFSIYNSISNDTTIGSYTYRLSDDKSKAYITFHVSSGSCSYDGAVIYFKYDSALCPTTNGSEVVGRTFYKVN